MSDIDRIVMSLKEGWTLTNRGTGWWLEEPHIPYKRGKSELISDIVVEELERNKIVRIDVPYISAKATLIGI